MVKEYVNKKGMLKDLIKSRLKFSFNKIIPICHNLEINEKQKYIKYKRKLLFKEFLFILEQNLFVVFVGDLKLCLLCL